MPDSVLASDVLTAVRAAGGALLTEYRLFDVYTGEKVDKGMRSLAISLVFRSQARTLTDEEADAPFRDIVNHLEKAFGAKLRG